VLIKTNVIVKKNIFYFKYFLLFVIIHSNAQIVSKKIGTNPMEINPAAALELESTTQGFLPPRMVDSQRDAISSPSTGLIIWCINCAIYGELQIYNGYNWVKLNLDLPTAPGWGTVTSALGRTWMDRNLGASRIATSSTDALAYGDLYQWGRGTDGHEKRTSGITTTISPTVQPGHGNFILVTGNWHNTGNNNLWQGVNGVNNPCPVGFKIPTTAEWAAEISNWTSNYITSAFSSPLKLPAGGYRETNANIQIVGLIGVYYSSTNGDFLVFDSSSINISNYYKARGYSVRCMKDY
jgi:Fibrobacter succinogenes major domain (Fib_succ_major)